MFFEFNYTPVSNFYGNFLPTYEQNSNNDGDDSGSGSNSQHFYLHSNLYEKSLCDFCVYIVLKTGKSTWLST